jgi:hypothetical protein
VDVSTNIDLNSFGITGRPHASRLSSSITKVVLIDVDATLMKNDVVPKLEFGDFGEMVEGAARGLRRLKEAGWFISIYTTRKATPRMVKWLRDGGAVWDTINSNEHNKYPGSTKPACGVLFDDRAWPLCGMQWTPEMWEAAVGALLEAGGDA